MKNLLNIIVLSMLACGSAASCSTDNNAVEDANAKIDSLVNARVLELETSARKKNDSVINNLAVARADSMMADTNALRVK